MHHFSSVRVCALCSCWCNWKQWESKQGKAVSCRWRPPAGKREALQPRKQLLKKNYWTQFQYGPLDLSLNILRTVFMSLTEKSTTHDQCMLPVGLVADRMRVTRFLWLLPWQVGISDASGALSMWQVNSTGTSANPFLVSPANWGLCRTHQKKRTKTWNLKRPSDLSVAIVSFSFFLFVVLVVRHCHFCPQCVRPRYLDLSWEMTSRFP